MSRLPRLGARRILAALQRAGFVIVRSKGSHHFLQHKNDPRRRTIIAMHPGDLPEGTVRAILKQAGISRDDFIALL
jgi:predicted RNA binding protein YcfA (HicA-like mRNA interferase family)